MKLKEMEVKDIINRSELNLPLRMSLVRFTFTYIQLV